MGNAESVFFDAAATQPTSQANSTSVWTRPGDAADHEIIEPNILTEPHTEWRRVGGMRGSSEQALRTGACNASAYRVIASAEFACLPPLQMLTGQIALPGSGWKQRHQHALRSAHRVWSPLVNWHVPLWRTGTAVREVTMSKPSRPSVSRIRFRCVAHSNAREFVCCRGSARLRCPIVSWHHCRPSQMR